MSNHNTPQENKQSQFMDLVDKIDTHIDKKHPNFERGIKSLGIMTVGALTLFGIGAGFNETGPRTTIDKEPTDVSSLDFNRARGIVLNETEKLANEHGISLEDISGVTDTTSSLLKDGKPGAVELSKKPFAGYVVSAETTSDNPANIPSQPDQQNK